MVDVIGISKAKEILSHPPKKEIYEALVREAFNNSERELNEFAMTIFENNILPSIGFRINPVLKENNMEVAIDPEKARTTVLMLLMVGYLLAKNQAMIQLPSLQIKM